MCLAVPMRVIRVEADVAWVDADGEERGVSLLGVDGAAPGDYLLVHAGLALARIDPVEAEEILALLREAALVGAGEELHG